MTGVTCIFLIVFAWFACAVAAHTAVEDSTFVDIADIVVVVVDVAFAAFAAFVAFAALVHHIHTRTRIAAAVIAAAAEIV